MTCGGDSVKHFRVGTPSANFTNMSCICLHSRSLQPLLVLIFCILSVVSTMRWKEGKVQRLQLEVNMCDSICCTTYIQIKKKNNKNILLSRVSFKTRQTISRPLYKAGINRYQENLFFYLYAYRKGFCLECIHHYQRRSR